MNRARMRHSKAVVTIFLCLKAVFFRLRLASHARQICFKGKQHQ